MSENTMTLDVDALANEIRSIDGSNRLGAGELAEKLMPWITAHLSRPVSVSDVQLDFSVNFMDGWLEGERNEVLRNWGNVKRAALEADRAEGNGND